MKAGIENISGGLNLREIQEFKEALNPELAYKILNDALELEISRLQRVPKGADILGRLDVVLPW